MKHNLVTYAAEQYNSNSTTGKLINSIKAAFPLAYNTGMGNDVGTIHPDPKSKGKAVIFTWKKSTLKLSEAMKVMEKDFTNTYVKSPLSIEAESIINAYLHPVAVQQTVEDKQAEEEIQTEAAVS